MHAYGPRHVIFSHAGTYSKRARSAEHASPLLGCFQSFAWKLTGCYVAWSYRCRDYEERLGKVRQQHSTFVALTQERAPRTPSMQRLSASSCVILSTLNPGLQQGKACLHLTEHIFALQGHHFLCLELGGQCVQQKMATEELLRLCSAHSSCMLSMCNWRIAARPLGAGYTKCRVRKMSWVRGILRRSQA